MIGAIQLSLLVMSRMGGGLTTLRGGWGVVVEYSRRVSLTQGGQATTLPVGRLPVGNWGCAEAGGVVYLYYLLCRRVVLLF